MATLIVVSKRRDKKMFSLMIWVASIALGMLLESKFHLVEKYFPTTSQTSNNDTSL